MFGNKLNSLTGGRRSKWSDYPMWLRILASVALLNFASFMVGHFILGGSAMNGYIKDGRYFLGNHGAFVEVSREVWSYGDRRNPKGRPSPEGRPFVLLATHNGRSKLRPYKDIPRIGIGG